MKREDIKIEDQWDLSLIYKDHDDFYKDLQIAKQLLNDLLTLKDTYLNTIENFIVFHNKQVDMFKNYITLHTCTQTLNQTSKTIKQCMPLSCLFIILFHHH